MSKKRVKVFKEFDEAHIYSILNKVNGYRVVKAPNTTKKMYAVLTKDNAYLKEKI